MKRKPRFMAYGGRGCVKDGLYSGIELKRAMCKHEHQETVSFDTVLVCLDCGKEEVIA